MLVDVRGTRMLLAHTHSAKAWPAGGQGGLGVRVDPQATTLMPWLIQSLSQGL
jgi:hypothetical protein